VVTLHRRICKSILLNWKHWPSTEGGTHGPQKWAWIRSAGVDSERIALFFLSRIRTRNQKYVINRTQIWSHFSISVTAGDCVVISYVKTWVNFGWIDDGTRSLTRSRILKFENLPDLDPYSEILEQERSWNLKKWLQPPLMGHDQKIDATFFRFVLQSVSETNINFSQRKMFLFRKHLRNESVCETKVNMLLFSKRKHLNLQTNWKRFRN